MARASANADHPDDRSSRRRRFQPSVWTFVAPVALAACILVTYTIAREAGWLERQHAAPAVASTPSSSTGNSSPSIDAMLYRSRRGETLMDIAVRFGIGMDRLRALNPKLPATGALPVGRRVRLR